MTKVIDFRASNSKLTHEAPQPDNANLNPADEISPNTVFAQPSKNPLWFLMTDMDTIVTANDKMVLREILGSAITIPTLINVVNQQPDITVLELLRVLGAVSTTTPEDE